MSPTNFARLAISNSGHTETITREKIEQLRPRDVFDLVNNAAGVIETQGGRKGFSGLSIRGDSNFVWLLDGAYLERTTASRIMRAIPVNIIEEVTIVRGAAALSLAPLVGSATPGGAPVDGFIVVRTRRPKGREVEGRTAVETLGTVQASAWAGNKVRAGGEDGYIAGSISHSSSNGPDDLLDNGATYNKAYNTRAGLVKAGFGVAGIMVDLTAYKDDGWYKVPNANSHGPGQGSWYVTPSETMMLILSATKTWSPEHTTLFTASRIESEQALWTANTSGGPYTRNYNPNVLTHFNLRHNFDLPTFRMSFGGDFRMWNAPNGQQYYEGIQRQEEVFGGFVQVEKRFFDNRWTIDAAIRVDQVNVVHGLDYYTGGAQPFGGVNTPLRTYDELQPPAKFYEIGSSFRLTDNWKFTGRFGMSEYGTSGIQALPGVTLDDESQTKIEVGAEGRISPWFNPSLNFFHREVVNEKQLVGYSYLATNNTKQTCRTGVVPSSGPLSPKAATELTPCFGQSDTTRDGMELTVFGQIWKGGSYRFNFTHFTSLENVELTTPHNMAGLTVQQSVAGFMLTGAVKYVDSYRGSATDVAPWLGGYTRIDAGIGREFRIDDATLRATIYGRNLTDQRFETSNGIQDVGRVIGIEGLVRF